MKVFLKKCRNDGRTRPIGLLGTQIGDQKLTGCMRACVKVYIYLYMGVDIEIKIINMFIDCFLISFHFKLKSIEVVLPSVLL